MADEIKNGVPVGRPDAPKPANKTDRVVYSDEEKADYERFGATAEPETPTPIYDPREQDDEKVEEKKEEEQKPSTTPTTPSNPSVPATPKA